MRFLLGLGALFALPLWADTQVTTKIHDIDHGEHVTDDSLVFLASGQVVKYRVNNITMRDSLNAFFLGRKTIRVTFDENREIQKVVKVSDKTLLPPPELPEEVKTVFGIDPMSGYTPSVISGELAKEMVRDSRHAAKEETQCFNRAHIWTYEWRVKHNIYSNKIWIFFTRKYIRRYNFEWWFHVAPMVHMIVDGQVKERVLDVKYARNPHAVQKWADIFLRDDAKCPLVTSYADHANYPEAGSCFFQKSPMYYYQPVNLEFLDKFGTVMSSWRETDLRQAYAEAFEVFP